MRGSIIKGLHDMFDLFIHTVAATLNRPGPTAGNRDVLRQGAEAVLAKGLGQLSMVRGLGSGLAVG